MQPRISVHRTRPTHQHSEVSVMGLLFGSSMLTNSFIVTSAPYQPRRELPIPNSRCTDGKGLISPEYTGQPGRVNWIHYINCRKNGNNVLWGVSVLRSQVHVTFWANKRMSRLDFTISVPRIGQLGASIPFSAFGYILVWHHHSKISQLPLPCWFLEQVQKWTLLSHLALGQSCLCIEKEYKFLYIAC